MSRLGSHHEYRPLLRQPFANNQDKIKDMNRVSINDLLDIECWGVQVESRSSSRTRSLISLQVDSPWFRIASMVPIRLERVPLSERCTVATDGWHHCHLSLDPIQGY